MVRTVIRDLLARFKIRAQSLLFTGRILADHTVGRLKNIIGRPVILFELDHQSILEIFLKIENIPDIGASERIDRLIVVAYDTQIPIAFRKHLDQHVLRMVRVLVLIDHDVAELFLIIGKDIGIRG